jgi:hypothetical protein
LILGRGVLILNYEQNKFIQLCCNSPFVCDRDLFLSAAAPPYGVALGDGRYGEWFHVAILGRIPAAANDPGIVALVFAHS